jgi:hypothetical protein
VFCTNTFNFYKKLALVLIKKFLKMKFNKYKNKNKNKILFENKKAAIRKKKQSKYHIKFK